MKGFRIPYWLAAEPRTLIMTLTPRGPSIAHEQNIGVSEQREGAFVPHIRCRPQSKVQTTGGGEARRLRNNSL